MVLHAHRKHRAKIRKPVMLAFVALFVELGLAFVDSVWSLYLDSFLQSAVLVGIVTGLLTLISVLFFFFSSPIIERHPETRVWLLSMVGGVIGYIGFYLTRDFALFLMIAVGVVVVNVLRRSSFGIMVRDATPIKEIGEEEGTVFTLINAGWLVGPMAAGAILSFWGFSPVFLLTVVSMILAVVLFKFSSIKDVEHHTRDDATIRGALRNLFSFFTDRERVKTYVLSGGVSLYWGILFVYMPLFIIGNGMSGTWVGLFLSATAVPLVLLEYGLGKLADRHGFKRFFIFGFAVLALCSFLAFLFVDIKVAMLIFVIGSVGAAFLEGTTEAYFFKITKKSEEEKYYGPYNTCDDIFSTAGKLSGAAVLFLLPQHYLFLLLACWMAVCLFTALSLRSGTQTV